MSVDCIDMDASRMVLDYDRSNSETQRTPLPIHPNVFRKLHARCRECEKSCVQRRWQNMEEHFDLCEECFANGKFDLIYNSADFTLSEALVQQDDDWTPDEVLSLLHAIISFRDPLDWNKISQSSGRSKEQCLLKFLQLPIQEKFLERKVMLWNLPPPSSYKEDDISCTSPIRVKSEPNFSLDTLMKEEVDPLEELLFGDKGEQEELKSEPSTSWSSSFQLESVKQEEWPLFTTTNPTMALISFLSAQFPPAVAAASASAVKTMVDTNYTDQKALYLAALTAAIDKAHSIQLREESLMHTSVLEAVTILSKRVTSKLHLLEQHTKQVDAERSQVSHSLRRQDPKQELIIISLSSHYYSYQVPPTDHMFLDLI